MNNWLIGALCAYLLAGAGVIGWTLKQVEVRNECERLGGFYVGSKVFECKAKEKK